MNFINASIDQYTSAMSTPVDKILHELEKETYQKVLQPNMLSGNYQGQLLQLISCIKSPERILEIGTYTGYSTICLANGLSDTGKIHTIEVNEELKPIQDKYFKKTGLADKIHQHFGHALGIIPHLNDKFDLVFIDADKKNYLSYLKLVYDLLQPNALILSDNVLWKGKVTFESKQDKIASYLDEYNQHLLDHKHISTLILPVRDGISMSIKT